MNKLNWPVIAVVAVLAGAAGYVLAPRQAADVSGTSDIAEPEVLFWRNPMNPAITSPIFMQDEMGMDYLPVYANDAAPSTSPGTVVIDPVVVQNIGVRTAVAERREISRQLSAVGHVDFDEERLSRLHPKVSGWVERLFVDQTGTTLERDSMLLEIYSPELVSAQQEYLVALQNWESLKQGSSQMRDNARQILDSARERLQLLDVPAHQMAQIDKTRKPMRSLHIHTPFAGQVMAIGAREGQYVAPKDELYLIADLQRVWVDVDVYENDLPWVRLGDKAVMQVRAAPGREFAGEVTFIQPVVDRRKRTVQVRLEFDNADGLLKPGMFANVMLMSDAQPAAVVVPSEAIVRSGQREQVYVALEAGKYEPREVRLGVSADGFTQITEGLETGEPVVVSSQFLIDSESKLLEATAKMLAPVAPEQSANELDMSDMDMSDLEGM